MRFCPAPSKPSSAYALRDPRDLAKVDCLDIASATRGRLPIRRGRSTHRVHPAELFGREGAQRFLHRQRVNRRADDWVKALSCPACESSFDEFFKSAPPVDIILGVLESRGTRG